MKPLILALTLLVPWLSWAETAEQKGLAIMKKTESADNGWKDQTSVLKMVLTDRHGRESTRQIHNRQMEVKGDGDKSIIVFDAPADLKGTAFLSHTHINAADDQWLYLKSLRRVKRISSNNKSGSFMGSEFSYEDIASYELDKYNYKYLRDEKLNGKDAYVVVMFPKYKYSGYTKIVAWIDKKIDRPLRMDFYDRKKSHLKTLLYIGYQKYNGNFYRPKEMRMNNLQTGKKTTLYYSDYKFGHNFTDRDFDVNALRRAR